MARPEVSLDRWPRLAAADVGKEWFELLPDIVAARKILRGEFPTVEDDVWKARLRLTDMYAILYRLRT